MTTILAIDQSTSATKAMLFNEQAELLEQVSIRHQQYFPKPGWVEHDAEEIYQNLLRAVKALKEKAPETFRKISWLSITNQRETIVVFDKKSGKPLSHAIVWQDRRAEAFCATLRNSGMGEVVHKKTGLMVDTYFPAGKLTWMKNNIPEVAEGLENGTALMGTIDTYLIYRLTKGKVYATDHTNASRTLFYDIDALNWDRDLIGIFGLKLNELPKIQESASVFGETDLEGLSEKPLPIAGVMGDSQAALFAEHCYQPGMAKITFGSGSSILMNIGNTRAQSDNGIVNAVAWVLNGQPTYAFEGITNFTGATISWLTDQLQLINNPAESEELAQSVPNNSGVYFVPAFVGLGAPYWKADAKGAIIGLTPGVKKEHIVRAALEGIGFTVTDVLKVMESEAGIPLTQLCADGGAVRNRFLMQFVADINHRDLLVSLLPELSALGAVFSGGLVTGVYRNTDDVQAINSGVIEYHPQLAIDSVEKLYAGWNQAIKKVLL